MTDDNPADYVSRIVDRTALARFLEAQLGPVADDEYELEHHQEGRSNETLFVTWGETDLVIRRSPPGEVTETAHDVLREYRVINALQDTSVRVPTTVSACDDHSILGCDFYVMERQTGDVIRSEEPVRFQDAASQKPLARNSSTGSSRFTTLTTKQSDWKPATSGTLTGSRRDRSTAG